MGSEADELDMEGLFMSSSSELDMEGPPDRPAVAAGQPPVAAVERPPAGDIPDAPTLLQAVASSSHNLVEVEGG
eukprot:10846377-Heterocapsa_arctica.AAC.1